MDPDARVEQYTEQDTEAQLPATVNQPRPATGDFGTTSPGAAGERQAREAVLAAAAAQHGNAIDLAGEKHPNAVGSDFMIGSQTAEGKTVVWAGDNKDFAHPSASSFNPQKMHGYADEALNAVAATNLPEPLTSNAVTGLPPEASYMPEDIFDVSTSASDQGYNSQGSNGQWDAIVAYLAAEDTAQREAGYVNTLATTTNSPLSKGSIEKLEAAGVSVMHVQDTSPTAGAIEDTLPAVAPTHSDVDPALPAVVPIMPDADDTLPALAIPNADTSAFLPLVSAEGTAAPSPAPSPEVTVPPSFTPDVSGTSIGSGPTLDP